MDAMMIGRRPILYSVEPTVETGQCDQCGDGWDKPISVVRMGEEIRFEASPYRFCWKCLDLAKSMIEESDLTMGLEFSE